MPASPIQIDLPAVPVAIEPSLDVSNLYQAVHNLRDGITGNPAAVNAAATDLATVIALTNQLRTRLINLGVVK